MHDDAHWGSQLKCISHPSANDNSPLCEWYIEPKYDNFREELTTNEICTISQQQWNNLYQKALAMSSTNKVRPMHCVRTTSAKYYDMKHKDMIQPKHLVAMMLYCNFEVCVTYHI